MLNGRPTYNISINQHAQSLMTETASLVTKNSCPTNLKYKFNSQPPIKSDYHLKLMKSHIYSSIAKKQTWWGDHRRLKVYVKCNAHAPKIQWTNSKNKNIQSKCSNIEKQIGQDKGTHPSHLYIFSPRSHSLAVNWSRQSSKDAASPCISTVKSIIFSNWFEIFSHFVHITWESYSMKT